MSKNPSETAFALGLAQYFLVSFYSVLPPGKLGGVTYNQDVNVRHCCIEHSAIRGRIYLERVLPPLAGQLYAMNGAECDANSIQRCRADAQDEAILKSRDTSLTDAQHEMRMLQPAEPEVLTQQTEGTYHPYVFEDELFGREVCPAVDLVHRLVMDLSAPMSESPSDQTTFPAIDNLAARVANLSGESFEMRPLTDAYDLGQSAPLPILTSQSTRPAPLPLQPLPIPPSPHVTHPLRFSPLPPSPSASPMFSPQSHRAVTLISSEKSTTRTRTLHDVSDLTRRSVHLVAAAIQAAAAENVTIIAIGEKLGRHTIGAFWEGYGTHAPRLGSTPARASIVVDFSPPPSARPKISGKTFAVTLYATEPTSAVAGPFPVRRRDDVASRIQVRSLKIHAIARCSCDELVETKTYTIASSQCEHAQLCKTLLHENVDLCSLLLTATCDAASAVGRASAAAASYDIPVMRSDCCVATAVTKWPESHAGSSQRRLFFASTRISVVPVVAIRHQYRSRILTRPVITCQSSSSMLHLLDFWVAASIAMLSLSY
jgi:hypothetical protein